MNATRRLAPEARRYLDSLPELPPLASFSIAELRQAYEANAAQYAADPVPVGEVQERLVDGPHGAIPVRLYEPAWGSSGGLLVYFHGGGWALGSVATVDGVCRRIVDRSGWMVASAGYRLAPECRFPKPLDDAYAAVRAMGDVAAQRGVPLAVGGESAGGNLAAAAAIRARNLAGPSLSLQVLVYPATEFSGNMASHRDYGEGYYLTTADLRWYWNLYVDDEKEGAGREVSPLRADHSGLPAALVITAGCDPIRDEGVTYAERLAAAGVPTEHVEYEGMIHGFLRMDRVFPASDAAIGRIADGLRAVGVPT